MEAFFYGAQQTRFIQFGKTLQFSTQMLEMRARLDLE